MKRHVRRRSAGLLATVLVSAGLVGLGTTPSAAAGPVAYTAVFGPGGCRIATIDLATGTTTLLSAPATVDACVSDLAVAPDGGLWAIDSNIVGGGPLLVQLDPTTGAIVASGPITGDFTLSGLVDGGIAFDAAGVMYVHIVTDETGCDSEYVCLYTVDPSTRVATFVGNSGQPETGMHFLTASCAGSMLTAEDVLGIHSAPETTPESTPEPVPSTTARTQRPDPPPGWPTGDVDAQNGLLGQQLADVNPDTGVVTRGAELPELFDLLGLEYDRVPGTLYALGLELQGPGSTGSDVDAAQVFDDIAIWEVDPATGELTLVADYDDSVGFPQGLAIGGECVVDAPLVVTFTG